MGVFSNEVSPEITKNRDPCPLCIWNVLKTQKMHAQYDGTLLRPANHVMAELCRMHFMRFWDISDT